MPNDVMPPVPTPESRFRTWLARNRKLAILLVLMLMLVVAVVIVRWRPWTNRATTGENSNTTSTSDGTSNTNGTSRTFERFNAAVNRSTPSSVTGLPRPTKEDTAKAINALTNK